ncbi:MAG: hypothetical protein JXQ82_09485, partial [Methanomicrobiaceae archaeon]|nr:hypothetical protein [Methanomicrobiaceae archaeon]
MDLKRILILAVTIALAALFCMPASAVIAEVNGMGTVSSVDTEQKTITITTEYQFSTTYSESEPISEWIASDVISTVTGTVPDESAFDTFKTGDPVRYIILGGDGGTYLGIAKITEISSKALITDIIGDPDRLVFKPLQGSYILSAESDANCAECTGTTCTASSADIKVVKTGETLVEKSLLPGESYSYSTYDPLDYDISVKFIEGEASSDVCQTSSFGMMTGPQAVSVYEIHITEGVLPLGPGPEIEP